MSSLQLECTARHRDLHYHAPTEMPRRAHTGTGFSSLAVVFMEEMPCPPYTCVPSPTAAKPSHSFNPSLGATPPSPGRCCPFWLSSPLAAVAKAPSSSTCV